MQQRFQDESRRAQFSPMELTSVVAFLAGQYRVRGVNLPDPGWEHVVRDTETGKEYWGHGPTEAEAKKWAWSQVPQN